MSSSSFVAACCFSSLVLSWEQIWNPERKPGYVWLEQDNNAYINVCSSQAVNEETPADLFVFSYDCCGFLDFQLCFFQLPPEHLLQLGQQEQDVKIILLKWQTNEKDMLTVHNDTTEAFNSVTWPGFALLEPASNHRLVTHMWSLTATKLGFFIYWVCWCVTGSLLPITQKENQP